MQMQKGSYTLEAAVWVSLLIFIFMGAIQSSLNLYREISRQEVSRDLEAFWAVDTFYLDNGIKEVLND